MPFAQALATRRFAVALEITPPKSSLPNVLLRRARLLEDMAMAVNVIQRPDRQSSLDASIELLGAGVNPVWHLVTRGKTRATLEAEMARARAAGIRNVLCIRGDHPGGSGEEVTVRAACEAACALPGMLVGATLNQYVPDREAVLKNLMPKLRAGARYVQTQPVFDLEMLRPLAETVLERTPGTHVVAMAMPLTSLEAAERFEKRIGVRLPEKLRRRIEGGSDGAWEAFGDTIAALAEDPAIAGVAIMTFEMDPSAETGARIMSAIEAVQPPRTLQR